jgi:sugar O-acyltransferase (sialic acid O-acetyltransferase NeuD family)
MKDIIILGAGGSGMDILGIIDAINEKTKAWNCLGFLDDNPQLIGQEILGYKVLGSIDDVVNYENCYFISSIAHPTNRIVRKFIWDRVTNASGRFATLVHPSSVIYPNVELSDGVVINANCTLGTGAVIKENIHLGYGCNIAHETIIGGHCSLGAGVNLSSGVTVGECSYIGCGVSSAHDVKIPHDTLIAVGTAVVEDIPYKKNTTWIGVPATTLKQYVKNNFLLAKVSEKTRR